MDFSNCWHKQLRVATVTEEERMCIREPLASHIGAHVNRLEQPHGSSHVNLQRHQLDAQLSPIFFSVTQTVPGKNRHRKHRVDSYIDTHCTFHYSFNAYNDAVCIYISAEYMTDMEKNCSRLAVFCILPLFKYKFHL